MRVEPRQSKSWLAFLPGALPHLEAPSGHGQYLAALCQKNVDPDPVFTHMDAQVQLHVVAGLDVTAVYIRAHHQQGRVDRPMHVERVVLVRALHHLEGLAELFHLLFACFRIAAESFHLLFPRMHVATQGIQLVRWRGLPAVWKREDEGGGGVWRGGRFSFDDRRRSGPVTHLLNDKLAEILQLTLEIGRLGRQIYLQQLDFGIEARLERLGRCGGQLQVRRRGGGVVRLEVCASRSVRGNTCAQPNAAYGHGTWTR